MAKAKTPKKKLNWLGWSVIILVLAAFGSCMGDEEEPTPVEQPEELSVIVEESTKQEIPEIDEPVEIEVEEPAEEEPAPVEDEPVAEVPPAPVMSVQQTPEPEEDDSPTGYITETGKRYHYDGTCGNGEYIPSTLAKAEKFGLTPCNKCVE